jgi:hypothetical protein
MHFLQIKEALGLGDNDYLDLNRDLQKLGLNPEDYKPNGLHEVPEEVVERLKVIHKPLEFLHKLSEAQLDYEILLENFRKSTKINNSLREENRQLKSLLRDLPKKQLVNLLLKATKCPF